MPNTPTAATRLEISLRPCGGFVAMILPKKEAVRQTPWQDGFQDGVHGFSDRGYETSTGATAVNILQK